MSDIYLTKDIINEVIDTVAETARQKGVKLNVDLSKARMENIYIDKMRIQQVFVNLLGNSIKFTKKGGNVYFIIESLKEPIKGTNCRITIKDTGIGMKKDFIPKAFEAFSQQKNIPTETAMGTGLGLAIVKQIVELMKGFIELKSEWGKGSQFDIFLPIERTNSPVIKEDLQTKAIELKGKNILLCEDHPINRELATCLLEKKGMKVVCAENGEIGVEAFSKSKLNFFDAILMDIRMPIMNGLEASKKIRALDRVDAKNIPIIALTANAFDVDRKDSEEAGMNAHLSKPIVIGDLYNTLQNLIAKYKK